MAQDLFLRDGGEDLCGVAAVIGDVDSSQTTFVRQETVFGDLGKVAGTKPTFAVFIGEDHFVGGFLIVQVAKHDVRTADEEFADLAVFQLFAGVIRIDDLDVVDRKRDTDRLVTVGRAGLRGNGGAGLRHTVTLDDGVLAAVGLEELVDLDLVFPRACVAADDRRDEEGHVEVFHQRGTDELTPVLGDTTGIVRFILLEVLGELLDRELGVQDNGDTVEQRQMHADHHTVDDERGQLVVPDVLAFDRETDVAVTPGHVVRDLVGNHDALRQTGRTAGVNDDTAGIFFEVGLDVGSAFAGGDEVIVFQSLLIVFDLRMLSAGLELIAQADGGRHGVVDPDDDDFFDAGADDSLFDQRVVEVEGDEDLRFDLVDVVLQSHNIRTGIDEVDGRTDLVGSVERIDDFRHVDETDHDIVIFLDAGGGQSTGTFVDVLEHLAKRGLLIEIVQRDLIGISFVDIVDQLIHRQSLRRFCANRIVVDKILFPGHVIRLVGDAILVKLFPGAIDRWITGFVAHNLASPY